MVGVDDVAGFEGCEAGAELLDVVVDQALGERRRRAGVQVAQRDAGVELDAVGIVRVRAPGHQLHAVAERGKRFRLGAFDNVHAAGVPRPGHRRRRGVHGDEGDPEGARHAVSIVARWIPVPRSVRERAAVRGRMTQ